VKKLLPALLVATCAALPGCTGADDTAVMVHVCLGVNAPADISFVRIVVDDITRPEQAHVFPVPAGSSWVTYSVRPGVELSAEEDFFLSVVGLSDSGAQRISRTVHTWFSPGVDRDVALFLQPSCLDVVCREGETCGGGICGPVTIVDDAACPGEM
jgi:hypothetical protein